jgi:cyclic di-GMP phosphodiesterase Gmr
LPTYGDRVPVSASLAADAGQGTSSSGSKRYASHIMAALKAAVGASDGAINAADFFSSLKSAVHFDRAVLLASGADGVQAIATETAPGENIGFHRVVLGEFQTVKVLPAGAQKQTLSEFVHAEENALAFPVAIGRRTAIAVLVRGETVPFSDNDLALARILSVGSLVNLMDRSSRKKETEVPQPAKREENLRTDVRDPHLFKIILDHLPISLTVQDSDGRFILANAMAAADLAVPADRLVGSAPADFLSPEDAIGRREWERSVIDGGETTTAETIVADHEGARVLLTSHTPVFITNNTLLISSSVDITEHREVERRLSERAHIDKLTGLPDRVRIQEYVEQLIDAGHGPFALAFIDLDNFKHVNDYYNHATGDALLIKIGERIKSRLRSGDMLARISGDEFLMLLHGFDSKEAVNALIEEVLADVKKPFHFEGFEIFSSCSIGVSFYPAHGRNYETLRRNADGAMYGAKDRAKGQAMYFDDGLGKQIAARMEAEQRLRLAIRDHRFVSAFQPKVDIHTNEVVGFETLVRWRDSDGEIHMPGHFISLAVELGLINPITNFVLNDTLASIDRLDAAFGAGTSMSINVGAKQAGDIPFMRSVIETIRNSGCGERLILELTEDAIVEKGAFQSEILPSLREIGVRISIDDFGTGYSSLSALADITADEIKIDRSFISRIHERPRNQSVLKAIESLGASLGMNMVAEGVETAEELLYLQATSRIRYAQGFYFSKPIYLDDMRAGMTIGGRAQDVRPVAMQDRISGRLRAPAPARGR